jgi:hypothetical protein
MSDFFATLLRTLCVLERVRVEGTCDDKLKLEQRTVPRPGVE